MDSINKVIENIRKLYPEYILAYRIGNFYQCFGRDAYIMSYIFGYKIKYIKKDIPSVGFPKKIVAKVQAMLEHKKINYMLLDTRNNYDVDHESDNGNLNEYREILNKSSDYVKMKLRIERNI